MCTDTFKKYRVRSDVHLVEICGSFLLISEKKARKECAYVRELNETAAFFWRLLKEGADMEGLVIEGMKAFEIEDPKELYSDLTELLCRLGEKGYLCEET